MQIFLLVCFVLFGLVIGSFLNVCIFRMPADESLIPDSHCPKCNNKLTWKEMVPVASFVIQKGKCKHCKEPISIQYPIVEALNGLLYALVFLACGLSVKGIIYCIIASILLVVSVIDERTLTIPRRCNQLILFLGALMCVFDFSPIASHILGMITISVFLFFLYVFTHRKGIGIGDLKLMFSAGLLLGVSKIWLAFFLGCVLGSVIHILRIKFTGKGHVLAFGPYLSAGIFLSALYGSFLIDWYLSLIWS